MRHCTGSPYVNNQTWQWTCPTCVPSTSVSFLCSQEIVCQLPSTFRGTGRPFVNFHLLFVWPEDLLPILYVTFRQHSGGRETFLQHLSTSRAAERSSVNFPQLSVEPGDLASTSVNFPGSRETFCQHLSTSRAMGDLLSKLRGAERLSSTSVTFTCGRETICQPSVRPEDFP